MTIYFTPFSEYSGTVMISGLSKKRLQRCITETVQLGFEYKSEGNTLIMLRGLGHTVTSHSKIIIFMMSKTNPSDKRRSLNLEESNSSSTINIRRLLTTILQRSFFFSLQFFLLLCKQIHHHSKTDSCD